MKKTLSIFLVIIMLLSFSACTTASKLEGAWETRPQVDDGGAVIEPEADEVFVFTFLPDGTGSQTMPDYGEVTVMEYEWSVDGKTLTITSGDGEFNFEIKIKKNILYMTPEKSPDTTLEYIRVS